jgi:hypothetical protein
LRPLLLTALALVGRLGPSDWQAAVLELDHHPEKVVAR